MQSGSVIRFYRLSDCNGIFPPLSIAIAVTLFIWRVDYSCFTRVAATTLEYRASGPLLQPY